MDALALLAHIQDGAGFTFTVLVYLLPLLLYCSWSTLVFLELANAPPPAPRVWAWSLATCCLPFVGPALFLTVGPTRLDRATRWATVGGGAALVALGLILTYTVFR